MGNTDIKKTELIFVVLIMLISFLPAMITIPINTDESYWISTSAYFEDWISLNTKATSWQMNYMTLSGPNIPKYIIAVGRLLGGYTKTDLNRTYNYEANYETNLLEGRIPETKLLMVSRIPMVILSILIGLIIYVFVYQMTNRVFALLWLCFFILNNSLKQMLLVAMSEPPLLFFSCIALLLLLLGQKYWISFGNNSAELKIQRKSYLCFSLTGISIGLAASSKIHAILLLIPYAFLLFYIFFVQSTSLNIKLKRIHFIRIFATSSFLAFLVFIFVNPFLYKNPIGNIGVLYQYRINEMGIQANQYTQLSVLPFFERIYVILVKLLSEFATIHGKLGTIINGFLLGIGIIYIIRDVVNAIRYRLSFSPMSFTFIFFSPLFFSAFLSPLLWLRYFLFPVFVLTIINTISLYKIVSFLGKRSKKIRGVRKECITTRE